MPKRRPTAQPSELFAELVEVLLLGWSAPYAELPGDDAFRIFSLSESDMARIWRGHRDELMTEWQTRGGTGQPWGVRYD
jgi:hypothetical protein